MKLPFQKACFLLSVKEAKELPHLKLPEVALVGRSNVGKSSLINHLLRNQGIAKVSSTPGKTQMLNFFSVDDGCTLVDLPGYGYSQSGKALRASWGSLLEDYFRNRKNLSLILFLLDLRHLPSEEDLAFAKWIASEQKPLLIVFTKADKLNKNQRPLHAKRNLENLMMSSGIAPLSFLTFSLKEAEGRFQLIREINHFLYGTT